MCNSKVLNFLGGFLDLDEHNNDQLYKKEEPPVILSGHRMPGDRRFDFVAFSDLRAPAGIEAKNVREWLYPRSRRSPRPTPESVRSQGCPGSCRRRIPFVTFNFFNAIGGIIHGICKNQRFPLTDAALAAKAADKTLAGLPPTSGSATNPTPA